MTNEDIAPRPGDLPGGHGRPSAAEAAACDPVAVLAAQIAESMRLEVKLGPELIAEKLPGNPDDMPAASELEAAERARGAAMVAMACEMRARSARGAMLHALIAIDQASTLAFAGALGDRQAITSERRRLERLLYSVAYYLAGREPDLDAQTLLNYYAPRNFDVAHQLERLRAA